MPARTPGSKAGKTALSTTKPSAAKAATPKSPSLDMGDDAGNIASSKKQLLFKTPADTSKSSAKKRPLAIQEEDEVPASKKGKSPGRVSKKVLRLSLSRRSCTSNTPNTMRQSQLNK